MRKAIILLAFACAGCNTTADLRYSGDTKSFNSTKDAKTVAMCMHDALEQNFSTATTSTKPTETGFSVSVSKEISMGKDQILLVDIKTTPAGSTSSIYSKLLWGEGKFQKMLEACQ